MPGSQQSKGSGGLLGPLPALPAGSDSIPITRAGLQKKQQAARQQQVDHASALREVAAVAVDGPSAPGTAANVNTSPQPKPESQTTGKEKAKATTTTKDPDEEMRNFALQMMRQAMARSGMSGSEGALPMSGGFGGWDGGFGTAPGAAEWRARQQQGAADKDAKRAVAEPPEKTSE